MEGTVQEVRGWLKRVIGHCEEFERQRKAVGWVEPYDKDEAEVWLDMVTGAQGGLLNSIDILLAKCFAVSTYLHTVFVAEIMESVYRLGADVALRRRVKVWLDHARGRRAQDLRKREVQNPYTAKLVSIMKAVTPPLLVHLNEASGFAAWLHQEWDKVCQYLDEYFNQEWTAEGVDAILGLWDSMQDLQHTVKQCVSDARNLAEKEVNNWWQLLFQHLQVAKRQQASRSARDA
jgi:hypothetical protein